MPTPADPWGSPAEPTSPQPWMYGRAPVPTPPLREPTTEFPPVSPPRFPRKVPDVSWARPSNAARRSLSDGWGFTAAGAIAVFCGWGVWAAAGRGSLSSPAFGLLLVLLVGGGVFGLARFFGYLVLEQMMGRPRPHARWSHFLTGLFLTAAGISYLVNTAWFSHAGDWVSEATTWVSEQWKRIV
jgi:eukaryotic-like serine/threonine-protein kinase